MRLKHADLSLNIIQYHFLFQCIGKRLYPTRPENYRDVLDTMQYDNKHKHKFCRCTYALLFPAIKLYFQYSL